MKILFQFLVATVFLSALCSCGAQNDYTCPSFTQIDGGYEIINCTVSDGKESFESLGSMENDEISIKELTVNGVSDYRHLNGQYIFHSPFQNFNSITAEVKYDSVKGILTYFGIAYLVVENENAEYVYRLSVQDSKTVEAMPYNDFIKSALEYSQTHDNTVSGGDGLS